MINLDLTEDIIKSFNSCVKSENYIPFLTDNRKFLDDLCSGLKKVKFENGTKFDWISQELRYSFNYLLKFDPGKETFSVVRFWEKYFSEISADIKRAISERNWSGFYEKYREDADFMISEARRQEKLDFNIYSGSGIFENFKIRDESVPHYTYQESKISENFKRRDLVASDEKESSNCLKQIPSFNTTNDSMKNSIKQNLEVGGSQMESIVEQKMSEFMTEKEEWWKKEISSLKTQLEEAKIVQEEMKTNFEKQLRTIESRLQTAFDSKIAELTQEFEKKLAKQKLDYQLKISQAKLAEKEELESKLQAVVMETEEIKDELELVRTETKKTVTSNFEVMRSNVTSIEGNVNVLNEKIEKLVEDVDRNQQKRNSFESVSSLEDLDGVNNSDSELDDQNDLDNANGDESDNDSIKQMEKEHQRKLLKQNKANEEELRKIRERREEINRKAEDERNALLARFGSFRMKT